MPTRDELIQMARQQAAAGNVQNAARIKRIIDEGKYENATSVGSAVLQGVGQGGTFGFGDELAAGLRAGIEKYINPGIYAATHSLNPDTGAEASFGELYDWYQDAHHGGSFGERYAQALGSQRDALATARKEHKGATLAGELSTGLLQGGAGASKAVLGQTLKAGLPRLMGVGAGYGGLAGAGYSEANPLDNPAQFGMDTGVGALGGAVMAPVPAAVGAGLRKVLRPFVGKAAGHAEQARRRLYEDLVRDAEAAGMPFDKTVNEIPAAMQARLAANPNMTVADLGRNLGQSAEMVAQTPGRGAAELVDFYRNRITGQYDRAMPEVQEALGGVGRNFAEIQRTVMDEARQVARPLYEESYQVPVRMTARMQELMQRPAVQAAYRRAVREAADEGVELGPELNMARIDYTIRALNNRAQRAALNDPADARRVRNIAAELTDEVGQQNEPFLRARQAWRGGRADEEALDIGTRIFREDADAVAEILRDMSQSELQHFRVGVMRAIERRLANKTDTSDITTELSKKRGVREALRVAFGSEERFNRFMALMRDEADMAHTFNKADRGSQTAARLAKQQDAMGNRLAGIAGMLTAPKAGLFPSVGGAAARGLYGALRGPGYEEAVRNAMAPLLRSNDLSVLAPPAGLRGGLLSSNTPLLPSLLGGPAGLLGGQMATGEWQ